MAKENSVQENEFSDEIQTLIKCRDCGAFLYSTDHGNHEVTYHCSSADVRFWDFERGSPEQIKAKEHCDNSKIELFFSRNSKQ